LQRNLKPAGSHARAPVTVCVEKQNTHSKLQVRENNLRKFPLFANNFGKFRISAIGCRKFL
jgi:hypothetical protein